MRPVTSTMVNDGGTLRHTRKLDEVITLERDLVGRQVGGVQAAAV